MGYSRIFVYCTQPALPPMCPVCTLENVSTHYDMLRDKLLELKLAVRNSDYQPGVPYSQEITVLLSLLSSRSSCREDVNKNASMFVSLYCTLTDDMSRRLVRFPAVS